MRSAIQTVFLLIFFLVFVFVALILVNRKYGLFNSLFPNSATKVQNITPTPATAASITPTTNKGGGVSRFPQIPGSGQSGSTTSTTKGNASSPTNTGNTQPTRIPNTGPETAYIATLLPLLLIGLKLRRAA